MEHRGCPRLVVHALFRIRKTRLHLLILLVLDHHQPNEPLAAVELLDEPSGLGHSAFLVDGEVRMYGGLAEMGVMMSVDRA